MKRNSTHTAPRRAGSAALAVVFALGASFGPMSTALAQSPQSIEVAQISSLSSSLVTLIKALPGNTEQEVYEAQIVAAVEAAGMSGDVTRMALQSVLKVEGLPGGAIGAIRSLLAKGIKGRMRSTSALGGGDGPGFGNSFGGGGGSDY